MLPYLDGTSRPTPAASSSRASTALPGRETRRAGRARGSARPRDLRRVRGHLGEAVKAICYAVDPEIIVLGGSVSKSYRFFQAALWETFQTYAYSIAKERLKIEVSETENIAILGAAALYFDAARG